MWRELKKRERIFQPRKNLDNYLSLFVFEYQFKSYQEKYSLMILLI